MPPRRSSRVRTLDAQSTSAGSSSTPSDNATGKRKRGQSVAVDDTDIETENVTRSTSRTKPPSSRTRTKPASTASTSKGRGGAGPERTRGSKASTKARGAGRLKEVPEESDEDAEGEDEEGEGGGDETPPARKKARKSVDDDQEEEEVVVRKPSRRGKSRQVAEEEDETDALPAPKTRRSSAKPPSSKTTKATRSSRKPLRLESDVEEEEQEEHAKDEDEAAIPISDDDDPPPVQKGRGRKPPSKSSKNVKTLNQEEEVEDTAPTPRPRRAASITPRKEPTPEQQGIADEEEDGLDGFEQEYKASPRRAKRQDGNKNSSPIQESRTPRRVPPVAEEEEHSLLEPRVKTQTQSQGPPVEEAKGPRARLVIHKMVLVNFKSYAGRQEIGPFHKVCVSTFVF